MLGPEGQMSPDQDRQGPTTRVTSDRSNRLYNQPKPIYHKAWYVNIQTLQNTKIINKLSDTDEQHTDAKILSDRHCVEGLHIISHHPRHNLTTRVLFYPNFPGELN